MRRHAAVAAAALLLAQTAAFAQKISNEGLFEKSLGAAEQALAFYGPYDNRAELRRMADIGYRVAEASGYEDFPFSFYLVDMPVPNAFALPGGQIFLTRGMLDLGLNDDMLAGLLGHEIGHVVHQHGVRMQRRATLLNVLSQALLVGVMISANGSSNDTGPVAPYGQRNGGGDRVMGAAAAGMVVSELLLRSYGREFEDEADDEGQRMAAGAGFDPDGTRQLMTLMRERLPETQEYGYWRTHPFFEKRVRAADVRQELLKIQEAAPADDYRRDTQSVLLAWREENPPEPRKPEPPRQSPRRGEIEPEPPETPDLIKIAALTAWPKGPAAERLRTEKLHRVRDRETAKLELARDFGQLKERYDRELEEVRELDPESPLVGALEAEMAGFDRELGRLYPKAVEVFAGGVYQTGFLEVFQSNYPSAPEYSDVALQLGDAYSRLGRTAEAVSQYLKAWRNAPDSEAGRRARNGLSALAPVLDRLAPLQELAELDGGGEISELASRRMEQLATSFKGLDNGSELLKRYPDSRWAEPVNTRLNTLADNLYGEVVLYQSVGDHAKALDRIQQILTQAPMSPAAKKLRERAVLET